MIDIKISLSDSDHLKEGYIRKESDSRILLSGSVGSGKTTTIKTLSDSFSTEDSFFLDGSDEPLVMDCGKIKLSTSDNLFLYAMDGLICSDPIQHETIWNNLQDEFIGAILLIDNRRKDPFRDLESFLVKLSNQNEIKFAIGVTHFDISRTPAISDYQVFMNNQTFITNQKPPVFSVDTRNYRDMSMLIEVLLYSLDPSIELI